MSCANLNWLELTGENTFNWQGITGIELNISNLTVVTRKSSHHKTSIDKQSPNHEAHQHSKTTSNIIEVCLSKSVKSIVIYFTTKQYFFRKEPNIFPPLQNCILRTLLQRLRDFESKFHWEVQREVFCLIYYYAYYCF